MRRRGIGRLGARRLGLCALICLGLFASRAAMADDTGACPDAIMRADLHGSVPMVIGAEAFDGLVGWIALNTSYDLARAYADPPTMSFCSVGEIVAYEGRDLLVETGLLAAYDLDDRHIHLVRPWSADDLFDRSVLLHEMIHDIQLSNRAWPCLSAPELEAYLLQDKWLRDHGVAHPFDWAAILAASRCTGAGVAR